MFATIMGAIGSMFGAITKVMAYMTKKDTENIIRKGYEEEKRADALEEDKVALEQVYKGVRDAKEVRDLVKAIRDADIKDADKSDIEVQSELNDIQDGEDKAQREKEIDAAHILKSRVDSTLKEIESDELFNDGNEITFKG